jgi:hypothetical protein
MIEGKPLVLLIDLFGACEFVRFVCRKEDEVLFLDAGLVHLGADLQDLGQARHIVVDEFRRIAREFAEAPIGQNDEADGHGDHEEHRDGQLGEKLQIVENTHCLSLARPQRRGKRAPPDALKIRPGDVGEYWLNPRYAVMVYISTVAARTS